MFGLVIAFKKIDWNKGILRSDWVGFDNFRYLFASSEAWIMTRNTILYNLAFIILGTIAAIAVAILLNEITSKFSVKVYQTLILLPYMISWVTVSYTHLRAHETRHDLVCRLLLEKKKKRRKSVSYFSCISYSADRDCI